MNSTESVAGQPERLSLLAANVKKDSGYRGKVSTRRDGNLRESCLKNARGEERYMG